MTNIRPKRGTYLDRLAAEGYFNPAGRFAESAPTAAESESEQVA